MSETGTGGPIASDETFRRLGMAAALVVALSVGAFLALLFLSGHVIPGRQLINYGLLAELAQPSSDYYGAYINILQVFLLTAVMSVICGVFVGLGRISKTPLTAGIARLYVEFFRGTPFLFQIMAIYYGVPAFFEPGTFPLTNFTWPAAIVALTLNHAAYSGEALRGGIESLPTGQMEAARSLGMSYVQAMRNVVLPQAWRNAVPAVGNDLIILVKDTSLLSVIAFPELISQFQYTYSQQFEAWAPLVLVGVFYLTITVPLSALVNYAGEVADPSRRAEP
ncbi:amino acid ABC transporter permease [Halolamina salifodinae]|uniref:Polar amino acid transport system permease protein n=1 Tax=Halolamina salifodinae TaxID=1202767 RepID=A0A8T4GSB9_9EURY|nr:amino acid ABC transporter permease [Halolamina salifodinae]MBP1985746.1 polar amino acid transport system permease protein [Halolamina salifodinae]